MKCVCEYCGKNFTAPDDGTEGDWDNGEMPACFKCIERMAEEDYTVCHPDGDEA